MRTTTVAVTGAVVLAVVVAAVAAALMLSSSDEPGTDAHEQIDPITTADEVAVAVMVGAHTWSPADQQSPWDALHAISDRLTGPMAQAASARPDPDPTPRQWDAWARSGDRVIGAADLAAGQKSVNDDAHTAERVVHVHQQVLHPDGETTPLEQITVTVDLERTGDQWKAANYQYDAIGSDR